MADGVAHLNGVMEMLPNVRLSITDMDYERSCAWWDGGNMFTAREAVSTGHDMYLCLSTDEQDLHRFSVRLKNPMFIAAGDTIDVNDDLADLIAQHVHLMIESGALLDA